MGCVVVHSNSPQTKLQSWDGVVGLWQTVRLALLNPNPPSTIGMDAVSPDVIGLRCWDLHDPRQTLPQSNVVPVAKFLCRPWFHHPRHVIGPRFFFFWTSLLKGKCHTCKPTRRAQSTQPPSLKMTGIAQHLMHGRRGTIHSSCAVPVKEGECKSPGRGACQN